jgi:chemotaxis protein MotB
MSKKQRKPKKVEEGAPLWMTTYSDMVTLLLTFFVLLLSFSTVEKKKFEEALVSIKDAMGILEKQMSVVQKPVDKIVSPQIRFENSVERAVKNLQEIPELRDEISFEKDDEGVHVRISNPLLFNSGEAELRTSSRSVLDTVGSVLAENIYKIVIEGHTDNVPINNDDYHSNWELSAARAVSLVEYFIGSGMAPHRFQAVAYGEYQPLAENTTNEGRATNRRVEIFIPYQNDWVDEIGNEVSKGSVINGRQ